MTISATAIATLLIVLNVLVILTNIVTEVLKKITPESLHTNLLAVIVAEVVTVAAFVVYVQYTALLTFWYYWIAVIGVGVLVAYAAMFGFDKLKEILSGIKTT
jgi:hypothetical protein